MSTLFYIHDPMCSWCWGYRRTWDQVRAHLPANLPVVNVLGGLAPDTDTPMPLTQRETIASHWKEVASRTGAQFNFDFWDRCTPRRSTYPACRAVLAARNQDAEESMIEAIQRAYYLRAMNPSDKETLIKLAQELSLGGRQFAADLESNKTEGDLQQEFALRRRLGVQSFPSLAMEIKDVIHPVGIDYLDSRPALAQITRLYGPSK